MRFKHHHTNTASDLITTKIILIVLFVFIAFAIAAYVIATYLVNRSMQQLHEHGMHGDLEARQLLSGEEFHDDYNTLHLCSPNANPHDLERRRRQRRERMRDQISEIHQIAVSRLSDEVSVSSDDSETAYEIGDPNQRQGQVQREEGGGDSSESDSDSDSDDVEETRRNLSAVRPLPRRVAMLRTAVRSLVD